MEETEAVARLQCGDLGGLGALMERYQQPALRVAYLVCHNSAIAEDTVEEAFVRLYERIHQFDTTRPFGPWFLRIVTNDALMATRQVRTHRHISLNTETEAADTVAYLISSELLPALLI